MKNLPVAIAFVLLMSFPVLLYSQHSGNEAILPLDSAIRTGKLANGFTYYIRHNEEPKNRVFLYLVNKVGSVLEDKDQRGLAHFIEHMNFNGTRHFPKNELVDYLQRSGIRFGADLNAYTSFDETVYQLPMASDKPELLAGGIRVMRDWAQEATLDPEEIDKERGVVLEEKRLGKGAGERMQRQSLPVTLNFSRYARRLPIGVDTVLNNFKPATIRRFYYDWYRPDLQALIIVGDIDVDQMEQTVRHQFSDLKNPEHQRERKQYNITLTGKNQYVVITDREMGATVAQVYIKHPHQPSATAADYRQNMIRGLFNLMLSKRYAELMMQSDPPFLRCTAGISSFMGGLDAFKANIYARPGELERGFKTFWREVERAKHYGFTSTEFERAKAVGLNGIETAVKEKNKTNSAVYVQACQDHFLNGAGNPGIMAEYALFKNCLPSISLEDVNNLAKDYITDINRDILIMAPEKDTAMLPDGATVGKWVKAVEHEGLQPYKDEVSSRPLLSIEPKPGKIVDEQFNRELNLSTLTLSNGVRVLIKPSDFKNDQILVNAFAPGGAFLYPDTDYQSAANAGNIIPAGGVSNYSFSQLNKYLEGKTANISPYIEDDYQGFNGNCAPKDLETALQMTYAYFTAPRKDTAVFKGIIARSRAAIMNRGTAPNAVFQDTIDAVLGNYDMHVTAPTLEKINQIDLDKAFAIYKERFADAANFTFCFVGSIDTAAIRPLLEKYLGSLPATHRHEQPKDPDIHIPPGKITKTVYKGNEPKANVVLVFSGDFEYTPENKVVLDALRETLQIRLLQQLRENESGVYSPAVAAGTNKYPQPRYSLSISFGCAPQNVEKLITSTLDEINKLRTDGPLQEDVEKWRAEEKTNMETRLKTNGYWLDYLTEQLENKDDLREVYDLPILWNKVTPVKLKGMATKCLGGDNFIRLVLLPEITK